MKQVYYSERGQQVIELLIQSKSNKQIALDLGISVRTVEFHLSRIYAKLGVASRTEAALRLSETNLWKSASRNLRESTGDLANHPADNGGKFALRRFMMKKPLVIIGGIGLGIALILTALSVLLVLNGPAKGMEFQQETTVNVPTELLSTTMASPRLRRRNTFSNRFASLLPNTIRRCKQKSKTEMSNSAKIPKPVKMFFSLKTNPISEF